MSVCVCVCERVRARERERERGKVFVIKSESGRVQVLEVWKGA